jgi:hypothetical protein
MADQWLHEKGRVEVRTHKLRISGHKKRTRHVQDEEEANKGGGRGGAGKGTS